MNRPPMAPHRPILSEDGASKHPICLPGPFDIIFDSFLLKLGSGPQGPALRGHKLYIYIYIYIYIYRSEGFPLTGLFHPWAQWDLGLDTLGNAFLGMHFLGMVSFLGMHFLCYFYF